jgi:hypothetical protein
MIGEELFVPCIACPSGSEFLGYIDEMPINVNDSYREGHIVLSELVHQTDIFLVGIAVWYQYEQIGKLKSDLMTYSIETTSFQVTIVGSEGEDQRR